MSGVVRYAVEFVYPIAENNVCVMTGHWGLQGLNTPTDADVLAVITAVTVWWETGQAGNPSGRSVSSIDCKPTRITAQKIRPLPPGPVLEIPQLFSAGTNTGDGLPPQNAVCVSLRTAVSSRSKRGRMFLPGIPESFSSSPGRLSATVQQNIADSFEGLRIALEALGPSNDGVMAVFSRVLDSFEPVTQIRVGNTLDTQRRRRLKDTTYLTGVP